MSLPLFDPSWWPVIGGGVAFVGVALFTPLVVRLAHRQGWVDRPKTDRWHERPTALMGGIAIFVAFTIGFVVGEVALGAPMPWTLWGGAALMFAAGLTDDLRGLSPAMKLIAQVAATLLLLYAGYSFGQGGPYWLSIPLTFLWVIGITNAVNLLDNMDGLAAGIAAIAAAVLAVYAGVAGGTAIAWALSAVAGAAAGFLLYNFKPARIFMGDCGSLFLGYAIAALAVVVQGHISGPQGLGVYLVSAAVLAVPIFDTTLVTVARALSGRAVSEGGRDHSSHRLVRLGLSEKRAVATLYAVSFACGALALFFHFSETQLFYALAVFFIVGLAVFGVHLGGAEVYRPEDDPEGSQRSAARLLSSQKSFTNGSAFTNGERDGRHVGDGASAALPRAQLTPVQKSIAVMQALVGRRWKSVVQLVADLLLVAAAFVLAHYLRFEEGLTTQREAALIAALPAVVALKLAAFWAGRLYKGLWRHAGTPELVRVVEASTGASVLCYAALAVFYGTGYLSEATFIIDWMIVTIAVVGVRFAFRGLRQYLSSKRQTGRRVLLYGAGDSGQLTLRGLRQRTDLDMVPVGFIDDDPEKHGLTAQGLAVLGTFENLEHVCRQHEVEEVLITAFRMSERRKREILSHCEALSIDCRVFNLALRPVAKPPQNTAPPQTVEMPPASMRE